jgi:hypothetical protein
MWTIILPIISISFNTDAMNPIKWIELILALITIIILWLIINKKIK